MERGKHQSTGKSSHKLVTNMLFQQNDINPCIYKRFCDDLDLEQHGDDFLVCGDTKFGKIDRGIQLTFSCEEV